MESATMPEREPSVVGEESSVDAEEQPKSEPPKKEFKVDLKVWFERFVLFIALALTWFFCSIVFRVLNRTTIYGKEHVSLLRRCLIVSNHQTLYDSFVVNWAIFFPWIMRHPDLAPSHLADAENFTSHGSLRYLYDVLRVIPVGRTAKGKRSDIAAVNDVRDVLGKGRNLHVFIEGSRSRTEELLPPLRVVGGHALVEGVTVLPVYFTGMHAVQPYYKSLADLPPTWWNRLFGRRGRHTEWLLNIRGGNRITVVIGAPISPKELITIAGQGSKHERQARVANEIMDRIMHLQEAVQAESWSTR